MMVTMKNEFFENKEVFPVMEGSNHREEFLLVYYPFLPSFT